MKEADTQNLQPNKDEKQNLQEMLPVKIYKIYKIIETLEEEKRVGPQWPMLRKATVSSEEVKGFIAGTFNKRFDGHNVTSETKTSSIQTLEDTF
jgi:hypothetical protein